MSSYLKAFVAVAGLLGLLVPTTGQADDNRHLHSTLSGFNEVHGPNLGIGAIFSTGSGRIKLKTDKQDREIRYELTYDFPDATPPVGAQFVNQAHLHFGQKHTTGGITVWLCQSTDNPAPASVATDTPICPTTSGKVTGTIRPEHVLGLTPQGLPAGDAGGFAALLAALRSGAIYANVHTDRFPPGEIRGHLDQDHDDD